MRRDSLFYCLFQRSPTLLFDLLPDPPPDASTYRFDSVAVKEPKFEIDGVFLPSTSSNSKTVYFCEVQFQKDEQLYERVFGESFLYFYRQRSRFEDWQAVVIYPSRSIEQTTIHPYRALLHSDQVHRVYLDELGDPQQLPLSVSLLSLTAASTTQAPEQARSLVQRTQQEIPTAAEQQAIIELIATILAYRFTQMTRQEIERMLELPLQETRFYQDAKAEGREEAFAQERALVMRQLQRKVGELPEAIAPQLAALTIEQVEALGEALLDFETVADLEYWLETTTM